MLGRWSDGVQALRDAGARLVDASGNEERYAVTVADDPADCQGSQVRPGACQVLANGASGRDLAEVPAGRWIGVDAAERPRQSRNPRRPGSARTACCWAPRPRGQLCSDRAWSSRVVKERSRSRHTRVQMPLREALESAGFKTEIVRRRKLSRLEQARHQFGHQSIDGTSACSKWPVAGASVGPRPDAGSCQRNRRGGLRRERGTCTSRRGQDSRERRASHSIQSLVDVPGRAARSTDRDRRNLWGRDSRRETAPHCDTHESGLLAIDPGSHGKPRGSGQRHRT